MGFEALHDEVSMYNVAGNTMCVSTCWVDYVLLRTCLAKYSTTAENIYEEQKEATIVVISMMSILALLYFKALLSNQF